MVQTPKIESKQHSIMTGGYAKYPITIPIRTMTTVKYIGLWSAKAI